MFVESSSMINLTCLVAWTAKPPDKVSLPPGEHKPGEPAQVLWLHNGSEVTYNGPRTGVSLIIDKSEVENVCTKKKPNIRGFDFGNFQGDDGDTSASASNERGLWQLHLQVEESLHKVIYRKITLQSTDIAMLCNNLLLGI